MSQKALNHVLTLKYSGGGPALPESSGILEKGWICVELWPFYCSKRISVPMSYISSWDIRVYLNLRIQVRMQIFSFFGMNRVFGKEIEVFRGWEYAGRHRINLLYLLNLSNVKKVHSMYVFDHFIANVV